MIHPYLYRQMSRTWLAKMNAALPVASLSPYSVLALFGSPGRPVGHAGRRGGVVGRGRRVEDADSVVVSSGVGEEEEPPSKKRSSSSSSSSKFWIVLTLR